MTDETRDPVMDEAGTGSDEARLLAPGNGGRPGVLDVRAPGSRNRSEETADVEERSDERGVEGVEDEEEDLDDEEEDEKDEELEEEEEEEEEDEDDAEDRT